MLQRGERQAYTRLLGEEVGKAEPGQGVDKTRADESEHCHQKSPTHALEPK